jgi:predicted DNA-binding transcriptional regulator AlpA
MNNPFETIDARLSNIENLLLDLKHPQKEKGDHPEEDQMLNLQQACELLKVSKQTVYGYVHRAQVPVFKKGKILYFSQHDLIQWIKSGRKQTKEEIDQAAMQYLNKKGLRNGK